MKDIIRVVSPANLLTLTSKTIQQSNNSNVWWSKYF